MPLSSSSLHKSLFTQEYTKVHLAQQTFIFSVVLTFGTNEFAGYFQFKNADSEIECPAEFAVVVL